MDIFIYTIESRDGIIDTVTYFNKKGRMKKITLLNFKLCADDVDYEKLFEIIDETERNCEKECKSNE